MSEKRFLCVALSVMTALTLSGEAWAGDGVVALQAADPSCADGTPTST